MASPSLSRSALTLVTATAVSVASYYLLRQSRNKHAREDKPIDSKTTDRVKYESDDDKTATTSTSSVPSELVLPATELNSVPKPPTVHVRSISRTREDITVILCTDQGHTIEGTILSKKEIGNADTVVSTLCEVATETKVLTFTTLEEAPEEGSEDSTDNPLDDDDESIPDVSLFFPKSDTSPNNGKVTERHTSLIRSMEDSDNVIMISPEDMAMMEQLMLQMDDDDELFDCGDEMGRRK